MIVRTNVEEYLTELQDLCKLFEVSEDISIIHTEQNDGEHYIDRFEYIKDDIRKQFLYSYKLDKALSPLRAKSYRKRMVKNHLYSLLSKQLGVTLPWGSLTGVRPTNFPRN